MVVWGLRQPCRVRRAFLSSTALVASISVVRWPGAGLLALSAATLLASPPSALAACLGEFTGTVLCDAANPATAGMLSTVFNSTTTVDINAGAGITTGAFVQNSTGVADLIFNNDGRAGIGNCRGDPWSFGVGNAGWR